MNTLLLNPLNLSFCVHFINLLAVILILSKWLSHFAQLLIKSSQSASCCISLTLAWVSQALNTLPSNSWKRAMQITLSRNAASRSHIQCWWRRENECEWSKEFKLNNMYTLTSQHYMYTLLRFACSAAQWRKFLIKVNINKIIQIYLHITIK